MSLYITLPISAAILYNSPQTLSKIVENVRSDPRARATAVARAGHTLPIAVTRVLASLTTLSPLFLPRFDACLRPTPPPHHTGTAEELH